MPTVADLVFIGLTGKCPVCGNPAQLKDGHNSWFAEWWLRFWRALSPSTRMALAVTSTIAVLFAAIFVAAFTIARLRWIGGVFAPVQIFLGIRWFIYVIVNGPQLD
jgi:ABC-type multidrug transport system permease subunit